MIVLDTDVLSALMRPAVPSEVEAWLLTVTDDVLCTTVVTVTWRHFRRDGSSAR